MFRTFLLVGAGGAIGSMMRYGVTLLLPRGSTATFPSATLLVNLLGCLVIGLLAGYTVRNAWMAHTAWPLLATGICGGFTTFSAFALDGLKLIETGASITALIYILTSIAGGILLCYTGYYVTSS